MSDLTWLYCVSFCTRAILALVTASFSWFSRESTMFCLSSSDRAFCLSRYSASARSLSSTLVCWLASSFSSHASMFSLVWSLTCRFWSTYSSISALAACDANFGSTESNDTSTRRLPRTGSTLTRPMNALTSAD